MLAILLSEEVFFPQDHEGPATHLAAKCCEINGLRPLDRGLLVRSGHSNLRSSPTEIRKRTFWCVHLDPVSGLASKVERVDVSSEIPGATISERGAPGSEVTDVFRRVTKGAVISPGGERSAVGAGLTVELGVSVTRHAALARTPFRGRVEPRAEGGEDHPVPDLLAHVEQERRVGDDARLG